MIASGGHGAISVFGVAAFVAGIAALFGLVIRRNTKQPMAWPDYALMFVGLAGAITGLAVMFLRFK
jgi:nitrate reductase gamma subunit